MNILCIGASGYIGSQLVEKLSIKHNCTAVDIGWFGVYDLNNKKWDYSELNKLYIQSFDAVILTAAHSSVPMCNEDHAGAIKNNVSNFIDLAQKLNPKQKFIYASSSCVYLSTDGRDAIETDPLVPNDMLSFSKTTTDHYLTAFNPCEWYALRFGSVNGFSKNFRNDLMINAMTLNGLKQGTLQISNGDNYRPILGMKDLVNAVERIIESTADLRGIYNISSFNTNIRNAGNKVSEILNCEIEDKGNTGSYDFTISSDKFCKAFDFEFSENIESIVSSIVEQKDYLLNKKFPPRKVKERNV